jgi:pyruvate/2-oxoglutarate dehydrogenase complex dihydrolipoamide acyltransferase (E2) component
MHGEDPVICLIPKHMLWAEHEYTEPIRAVPLGQACRLRDGSDVTVIAWGNTVEKSLEALDKIGNKISVELIDLRSIVPWDKATIEESVRKTRRLVVVQEDTENCSVGQMIISHITSTPELWNEMISPPILVSKANVMIGYNPIYEYAALPDVERVLAAIRRSVGTRHERAVVAAGADRGCPSPEPEILAPASAPPATAEAGKQRIQSITVPVMGEGIRNAKVVSLLKNPGDEIALDDELCEVETDKAVYPIQSSYAGIMGQWKTKVGETVEIGQELGTILTTEPSPVYQFEKAAKESISNAVPANAERNYPVSQRETGPPRSPSPATTIEPALSPTITRKLLHVIPANLQIDARWDAIRKARDAAKRENGKHSPSPSAMIAWAVVRAMEQHSPFRRLILEDERIVENENFDLGIAVALEGDRLATAVIVDANKKAWPDFVKTYNEAIDGTRDGRVDAMNASVVITSLGAFGVKAGAPIVVPPSVGTLFIGTAHRELIPNGKKNESAEVITVSLTFDHRVVNGAGAASFANEIKKQIERFKIPATTAVSA